MRPQIAPFLLLLAIAGCQAPAPAELPGPAPPPASGIVASAPPERPAVRPDLKRQWLKPDGTPRYPAGAGFAGPSSLVVLPPGLLLDRFGSERGGRFFSAKGASHDARALPSVCAAQAYGVYRVRAPLPAWAGQAAPWFGEPGGATQFKTDATAEMLLADGVLERVPHPGPPPCGP